MRVFAIVGLLAASVLWAQEPASNSQLAPSTVQAEAPPASQKQTITIPAGTRIPLALTGPISAKARPGDSVRAVTGFPVTVGTRLAIPVGTYVEGVIDKLTRGHRSGPSVQMHFTRMLYANGYTVSIDGMNVAAEARPPDSSSTATAEVVSGSGSENSLVPQSQSPTVPTPAPAPHIGTAVGLGIGAAAAGTITAVLLARHSRGTRVLFDTGWQFEMVLESPLSVDSASAASAASGPQ